MKDLLRLIRFLKPFTGWVGLSVLAGVATVVGNIALLGTSAYLIAAAALHPSIAELQVAVVGVRFWGISRGLFRYGERLSSHSVNFRLLARLRTWFYQAIEPLAPARLVHRQSGDLLSRAIGDIETLENFYVRAVSPVIVAAVVTAGMGWYVGRFSADLGRILSGGLLLSAVAVPMLAEWINREPGRRWVDARAELSARIVDFVQGLGDLWAYGAGPDLLNEIRAASTAGMQAQRRMLWRGAVTGALNQLLTHLTLWAVLATAVPLVSDGSLEGVLLAVLVLVTLASFEAVTPLAQAAQFWQSSLRAARRLFEIADEQPAVCDPHVPLPVPEHPVVQLHDLTFAYEAKLQPVLRQVSLTLKPGKVLAVVGPSGSGKTTLANILQRFWDAGPGMVTLDGQDLRQFAGADVRNRISVVAQSTYIFNASLRENLLLAQPAAQDEDLTQALVRVQLGDWLQTLADGLDTWLGERGTQVSAGQGQRLALARALLRDTPIVILDEPTANLDAFTERQTLGLLREALRGRSVLWITHRLTGMDWADEILVLEQGRVVEHGTEAALLAAGGIYAGMKAAQVRLA